MGEARRRKLAGSGPVPPKKRNIRVSRPMIGHVGGGRAGVLSAIALMMSMESTDLTLPTKRERGK